jgi:hypothetical protein
MDPETGEEITVLPNDLRVQALSYWSGEPNGHTLQLLVHEIQGEESERAWYRMHPETGDFFHEVALPYEQDLAVSGFAVIEGYPEHFITLAGLVDGEEGDMLAGWQVDVDLNWASVTPHNFAIEPEDSVEVEVVFTRDGRENGLYEGMIEATHTSIIGRTEIPLAMTIDIVSVDEGVEEALPGTWALDTPYPNPFNSTARIRFTVPSRERVSLRVYDLLGREVARLHEGVMQAGSHQVSFEANGMASGLYFVRMQGAGFDATRKMLLVK